MYYLVMVKLFVARLILFPFHSFFVLFLFLDSTEKGAKQRHFFVQEGKGDRRKENLIFLLAG